MLCVKRHGMHTNRFVRHRNVQLKPKFQISTQFSSMNEFRDLSYQFRIEMPLNPLYS